ncbi:MAG TPA: methyltransferase domain-containing protein [Caulobacteraceae bacterium]|nr:methyltransferase domain-containing protein [Caulobacteraceae bacterium]
MAAPPRLFDRALHRRRLDRAAVHFAKADFLQRRVAEDLAERLAAAERVFPLALDLAARNGAFAAALAAAAPAAKVGALVQADLSPAMATRLAGPRIVLDEEALPIAPSSVDLIVSGLSLHFANDLVGALAQIRRALKDGGLFLGALLGGGSLSELRAALLQAETEVAGGAGPRVSPVLDPADAPGLLQRAGFTDPVVDIDAVRARYPDMLSLLADLRAMGATSVLAERTGTLSRAALARAGAIYAERFAAEDGRLIATFEIIILTGWAPTP